MDIKNLTPEQIEKAKSCKTTQELIALAEAEGPADAAARQVSERVAEIRSTFSVTV